MHRPEKEPKLQPHFFIQDAARDVQIITKAFCRIYSLAFAMTGDELIAEQLELETRAATAEAVEKLRFAEFPEQRLFDRIADAQFIYQCEMFFSSAQGGSAFGELVVLPPISPAEAGLGETLRRMKTTELQEKVLMLPATERLIYLLLYAADYCVADVGRLLRMPHDSVSRAGVNACVMLRELLRDKRAA